MLNLLRASPAGTTSGSGSGSARIGAGARYSVHEQPRSAQCPSSSSGWRASPCPHLHGSASGSVTRFWLLVSGFGTVGVAGGVTAASGERRGCTFSAVTGTYCKQVHLFTAHCGASSL